MIGKLEMTDQTGTDVTQVSVQSQPNFDRQKEKSFLAGGGLLGALAMSSCCVMPVLLFSLGATGAWIGALASLYQYKWIFLLITAGFLAGGFYMVYRKRPAVECAPGTYCAIPLSDRINKIVLWLASVLALVAFAFPYLAPLILDV